MDKSEEMKRFFEPRSIAVFGSYREGFGGYMIVKNLLNFGFSGRIYPVNPSYKEVLGLKVYHNIRDVPEGADLAIILVPRDIVLTVVEECAERGTKAFVIGSDGFAERDDEGGRLQQRLVEFARRAGIRILGPNTVGVVNTASGLMTDQFIVGGIQRGAVSLVAQTGIVGPQAISFTQYGISKICDLGNKCDVDECDILEYLTGDWETKVVAMYLEGVRDGQRFLDISRKAAQNKPILVLKSGRTKEGARAAASHTGSLAGGEDRIYSAAFKQAGIIRVEKFSQLLDFAKALAYQPLPKGNKVAIITITGGAGVMQTDAAIKCGLTLSKLSMQTIDGLTNVFPELTINPFDLGPASLAASRKSSLSSLYNEVIEAVLGDKNVDCVAVVLYAGEVSGPGFNPEILHELGKNASKPMAIWIYGYDVPLIREWSGILESFNIPVYSELEDAIAALGILFKYSKIRQKLSPSLKH